MLVLFGSFTEEETRELHKKSSKLESPTWTTGLRFGSMDSNIVLSSSELKSEESGSELSQKSQNLLAESSITEDSTGDKKKTKTNKNGKVPVTQANGSIDKHQHGQCLTENGKLEATLSSACNLRESEFTDLAALDADADKDIMESSSKGKFIVTSPVAINSNEEFQRRNAPKSEEGNLPVKSLLPCGLINTGNLCFLNSTLQALLSCTPFVQLFQNLRSCHVPKAGYQTVHAFVEFISKFDIPDASISTMNEHSVIETGTSFIPAMFEPVLKSFTPELHSNMSSRPRQEDAQEFLSFVMDQLHNELLKLDGLLSNSTGTLSSLISSQEEDGWETVGPRNKSAVTRTQSFMPSELSDIFGGQLRSLVKARGNKASATVQPFLLLHLDICPDSVNTIQDALRLFSAPETLEGYKTSHGKTGVVSASKSVKIQKLSKIMILHLMRFSYGITGSAKLHKPVHFPLEFVVGRELLVSPTSEGRKYQLVATITHHGRDPSKGHYTTDARYSNGRWLRYDDASITIVPTSRVLHDQAYVLFYKQL